MTCKHIEWVHPKPYFDEWTGETVYPDPYTLSTTVDIDISRYKCTQCGEVFYYTGAWQRYHEDGVYCLGSEEVKRK